MIVYPAIDLMDGACVRLRQGRFNEASVYPEEPAEGARRFAAAGAAWIHVVDLDGARHGAPRQHDLFGGIAAAGEAKVQAAGGFADEDSVSAALEAGVARVVLGSLAVDQPKAAGALLARFGSERIALALDVRLDEAGQPILATRGWTTSAGASLWTVAERYPGLRHLLVTDIARDGVLAGPNLSLVAAIRRRLPNARLQASGGIASLADIAALREAGAAGAIVGRAIWEGRMDAAAAIAEGLRHAGA